MYFAEASEDKVFEKFAADPAGANEEDFGRGVSVIIGSIVVAILLPE